MRLLPASPRSHPQSCPKQPLVPQRSHGRLESIKQVRQSLFFMVNLMQAFALKTIRRRTKLDRALFDTHLYCSRVLMQLLEEQND